MRHEVHYQVLMPVKKPSPLLTGVQFAATLLIGILLMPAGAHVLEMPSKIGLPPETLVAFCALLLAILTSRGLALPARPPGSAAER